MNCNDASRLTRELLDKHGLTSVRVVINPRLTSTFGRYRYSRLYPDKRIELSKKLVLLNNEERVMQTIRHEVAHALTEGHKHDSVWQQVCLELGGTGQTYYSVANTVMPEQKPRSSRLYTLECSKCGFSGGRYRRKMTGYAHKYCGGELLNIELS